MSSIVHSKSLYSKKIRKKINLFFLLNVQKTIENYNYAFWDVDVEYAQHKQKAKEVRRYRMEMNSVEYEDKANSGRLWTLAPLVGKYYGTVVCYDGENVLKVFKPDYSAIPFASTREILHGWTPEDGHRFVEDQQSYRLAKRLIEFLNQTGFELK